jgi:hypothetical protein
MGLGFLSQQRAYVFFLILVTMSSCSPRASNWQHTGPKRICIGAMWDFLHYELQVVEVIIATHTPSERCLQEWE